MRWPSNWLKRFGNSLEAGIVFAVSGLLFAWYQSTPTFPDPDSFYHARFVSLMLEHGIVKQFPWLPLTTLGQNFADHHLLYHIALMPAVYFLGPLIGVKVMQVLFGVAVVAVAYRILKRWKIPYAGPAMLLLLSSYPMLVRMNLVKASAAAVILFLLVLVALIDRKYVAAAIFTIIYTLTHGGFFLAGVLAVVVWIAQSIVDYNQHRKNFVPTLPIGIFAVVVAMVMGVVANPYFPSNLPFLWAQFFQIGVVNYQSVIEVGAEWYPFALPDLISAISVLLLCLVGVIVVVVVQRKIIAKDHRFLTLAMLLPLFFVLTLRSRRFIEYLVPVLWLLVCVVLLPAIQSGVITKLWKVMGRAVGRMMWVVNVYLILAVGFAVVSPYFNLVRDFSNDTALDHLAATGAYLRTVTQPNAVVFHGKWDDFPELFYYDPNAAYVVGLDATFLYLASHERYQQWHDISAGVAKQQTAQKIRDQFHAQYVVVDASDEKTKLMLAYLLRDPSVRLTFTDQQMRVFDLGL